MRNFYEVGKIYVWTEQCLDKHSIGKECTVIGDVRFHTGDYVQLTDFKLSESNKVYALKGSLRPKNPPSGEKSISEMFSKPYVKELDKQKELEEAYE